MRQERTVQSSIFDLFAGHEISRELKAMSQWLVSLFEPHADIIVKGSRDVDYGHKLNLTTGRSGLVLDLVVVKDLRLALAGALHDRRRRRPFARQEPAARHTAANLTAARKFLGSLS
ncbi:hypothetical protein [Ensifer sp. MJa1]|uniref:hypothetical protein n=1 Tax=Ensifer sp. MJa1 TaxID=2919888 RepID=UPI003FA5C476